MRRIHTAVLLEPVATDRYPDDELQVSRDQLCLWADVATAYAELLATPSDNKERATQP